MEEVDGCLLYSYDPLTNEITLEQTVKFDTKLLDFSIDSDYLVLITHTKVYKFHISGVFVFILKRFTFHLRRFATFS